MTDRTWTIGSVVKWATDDFRARGIESPRLDAELGAEGGSGDFGCSCAYAPAANEPLAGSPRAVSGILWVLLVFTALHGLVRSFDEDFRDDALRGLLLTGADPAGIYFGRVASITLFVLPVAFAAIGAVAVLFATPSLVRVLPGLAAVLVLAVIGLAAAGGILAVLSHHASLGETLLPLLFLPLAIPVLLAGVESVATLLEAGVVDTGWLRVLVFYAIGMLAASTIVFEYAVEE